MGKITLSKKVESVNSAVAQKVLFDLVVNSNLRKIRKYSELEKLACEYIPKAQLR